MNSLVLLISESLEDTPFSRDWKVGMLLSSSEFVGPTPGEGETPVVSGKFNDQISHSLETDLQIV